MSAAITILRPVTDGGVITYKGRTIDSIIRNRFGKKASFWGSADRNSPYAGSIVEPYKYDTSTSVVLATVLHLSGDWEPDPADLD